MIEASIPRPAGQDFIEEVQQGTWRFREFLTAKQQQAQKFLNSHLVRKEKPFAELSPEQQKKRTANLQMKAWRQAENEAGYDKKVNIGALFRSLPSAGVVFAPGLGLNSIAEKQVALERPQYAETATVNSEYAQQGDYINIEGPIGKECAEKIFTDEATRNSLYSRYNVPPNIYFTASSFWQETKSTDYINRNSGLPVVDRIFLEKSDGSILLPVGIDDTKINNTDPNDDIFRVQLSAEDSEGFINYFNSCRDNTPPKQESAKTPWGVILGGLAAAGLAIKFLKSRGSKDSGLSEPEVDRPRKTLDQKLAEQNVQQQHSQDNRRGKTFQMYDKHGNPLGGTITGEHEGLARSAWSKKNPRAAHLGESKENKK